MGRPLSDSKKSEIVKKYLQGLVRDDISKETGFSTGTVSGVVREFEDCADSSSLEEAAEKYDVVETVESLRDLAVKLKKNGTTVEELIAFSKQLERVRQFIPPERAERLEEFIKAGESLGDKAHVEASIRMHTIEEHTGRSHDEIVADLESKVAKAKEVSSEIQRLNSEKARLEAELSERLKQHNLTLERIEHVAKIESELSKHNIDLTKLEELRPIFDTIQQSGYDPRKVVEQLKKEGSLKAQMEEEIKSLANIEERKAKLAEIFSSYEDKVREMELLVEKANALVSMGWNNESLDKAAKLTKAVGSVEQVLDRLELLKPSADAKAELERVTAERDALKEENLKAIKETSKTLSTLTKESSILVNEKIPCIIAEYNNLAERYNKLQADFSKVDEQYRRHQNRLEEALNWSKFLQQPEKLHGNTIRHIFFDIMIPQLEIWCKRRDDRERSDIVRELAAKAIRLCVELERTL